MVSINDMSGCHSIFSKMRAGLFLRSLVCLWNFCRYFISKLGFLNLMIMAILGPNNPFSHYRMLSTIYGFLPSRYQKISSSPSCENQKCLQALASVPRGAKAPQLRTTDLDKIRIPGQIQVNPFLSLFYLSTNVS